MDVVSIIETVIKDHPFIDFELEHKTFTEYWCLCPCGHSTKHYKTQKSAQKAFKAHIVEEVNEALIEQSLLVLNDEAKKTYKRRTSLPTQPNTSPALV